MDARGGERGTKQGEPTGPSCEAFPGCVVSGVQANPLRSCALTRVFSSRGSRRMVHRSESTAAGTKLVRWTGVWSLSDDRDVGRFRDRLMTSSSSFSTAPR